MARTQEEAVMTHRKDSTTILTWVTLSALGVVMVASVTFSVIRLGDPVGLHTPMPQSDTDPVPTVSISPEPSRP